VDGKVPRLITDVFHVAMFRIRPGLTVLMVSSPGLSSLNSLA
jgi:hypothetical protein